LFLKLKRILRDLHDLVPKKVPSPDKLNTSLENFWVYLSGQKAGEGSSEACVIAARIHSPLRSSLANKRTGNMVDVRNLAEAHVEALVRDEAGGQRFAVSQRTYCFF
jgi:nucleoside-diphosphate-sugar epimerase